VEFEADALLRTGESLTKELGGIRIARSTAEFAKAYFYAKDPATQRPRNIFQGRARLELPQQALVFRRRPRPACLRA
jgi:hypothetical protein